MDGGPKPIRFHYKISSPGRKTREFMVELDPVSLNPVPEARRKHPAWTELQRNKCPNCPLQESEHKHCPAAVSVETLMEAFSDSVSHHPATVTVETETRNYSKETTLQKALSSLMGVHMVTSGCPILAKLKPMVRNHLPFASSSENSYRVLSMYLMAQFLRAREGKSADWAMKNLSALYDEIRVVNKSFCDRLRNALTGDAGLNAIISLNAFADLVSFSLDEKGELEELKRMFRAYLD